LLLLPMYNIMQNMQVKQNIPRSPEHNIADILNELDHYRLENRVTQGELAYAIGVNFSTVSRWLNGKTIPNKIQQYHIEKYVKYAKRKKAKV